MSNEGISSTYQETGPVITVLRPALEDVQKHWHRRMLRHKGLAAFAPDVENMPQWELEVRLGRLIEQATEYGESAREAEIKALTARWNEAEAAANIAECRQCLGLPDAAISQPEGQDDGA